MKTNLSRWLGPGIYSLLNRLVMVGFGFVNVVLLVRMLSKPEFGTWALYLSVTSVLELMKQGFIQNPFIATWVGSNEEQQSDVLGSSLLLNVGLSLILFLIVWLSAPSIAQLWHSTTLHHALYIYAFQNIVFVPLLYFESLQLIKLQYEGIFISNVIRHGILTLYILGALMLKIDISLFNLALAQTIGTVLAAATAYLYVRGLVSLKMRVDKLIVYRLVHLGKFTFGTNLSSMVLKNTDAWMLGKMATPAAVAVYNPALKLSNIFEVPTMAIATMVFPQIGSKMKHQGKKGIREIYEKSVSLMLALILPVMIVVFVLAEWIVSLIFGPDYIDSVAILRVTVLHSMIVPFNRQFGTVFDGLQKPRWNFYVLLFTALLNIVLNIILFNIFGLIGCAYATLLSIATVFIFNQIVLYRTFRISVLTVLQNVLQWYVNGWAILMRKVSRALQA